MTTFDTLVARRAKLLAELEDIEKAIATHQAAEPVEICTHRNLRNTPYLTVDPLERTELAAVYADREMTTLAREASHGGWISFEAAAWLESFRAIDNDYIWLKEKDNGRFH